MVFSVTEFVKSALENLMIPKYLTILDVHGSVHRNIKLRKNQQDAIV